MWDKIFEWGSNSKNLANVGQFIAPVVSGWSAYKQSKAMEDANELMKKNYAYNKSINDANIAKQNMEQENITSAFDNTFGTNKKKKNLDAYAGIYNFQG